MKILYLCTHQIHNLTPLFREISKNKKINFKVLYWQRILADYHDPEFDKIINFGIDQFSGYKYYCLFNDEKVKYDLSFVFKLKILVKLFFFFIKGGLRCDCFSGLHISKYLFFDSFKS